MKKLFGIIATALFLISFTAQVAVGQEGNFENDGTVYDGRILVITDAGGQDVTYCGREMVEYKAVLIDEGGPAIVTTVAIPRSVVVSPGDRFDISGGAGCGGSTRISTQLTPRRRN